MLSKKYYIKIAEILKNSKDKEEIIKNLYLYFKLDNPNFKIQKFIDFINKE